MSIPEKMTGALQENLLTLLAYSDEHGKFVASVLDPQLFEGDMRIMAERIIGYWRTEKRAPKFHTADLFADILEDRANRRAPTFRRMMSAMLQLSEGINDKWVLSQLKNFTRMQKLKDAIFRSAEILNQAGETTVTDVEAILSDILRARDFLFDPGYSLERDYDVVLDYLAQHYREFDTGIESFDKNDIVPSRGTLFLLLGASGVGKTWGMVHLGRRALQQRKRVLHITPEISGQDTMLRYYMAIFGVPKRHVKDLRSPVFEKDNKGRFVDFDKENITPDFEFDSPTIREELQSNIANFNLDLIRIKQVAPRSMTIDALIGYLDSLENTEGFVPDLLIVDSAYLLRTDSGLKEYRHALGRIYERLRGIGVDRNMAVAASHQLSKEGAKSRRSSYTHIAEDWSIIQTADIAVVHSATKAEQEFGLARLYADKVRNDKSDLSVLITQNYAIGGYMLDSVRIPTDYFDIADREFGEGFDGEGGEDDDDSDE